MSSIIKFNISYFALAALLFMTELAIALFVHDAFIRPYFGDFLVVALIYCCIKSFIDFPVLKVAVFVLIFSYAIEILQYCNLIEMLGLQRSAFAKTVLGHSFSWSDMLAYTLGIVTVILIEFKIHPEKSKF